MLLSVRDEVEALDPAVVQILISQGFIQQYFFVATLTLLAYDILITIDKEVEFFWGASLRRPITIAYFMNRYVGILGAFARLFCKFSGWTVSIAGWIVIVVIDYILMVRVLALYSQHRKLSLFLFTILGLEAAAKLAIVIYGTWFQDISSVLIADDLIICGVFENVSLTLATIDWVIPMAYGLILMALAIYRAAEYWKLSSGFRGFRLVKVLIQDQAIYFSVAVFCCVLNLLEFRLDLNGASLKDGTLSVILTQLGSPLFLCVLGSRMLFNLKEAGKLGVNEGTNYRTKTMSAMEFEQPNGDQRSESFGVN